MSDLKLLLLGPTRLERSGIPIKIDTRKALALLIYLAVTNQYHSRDSLATLFWPENNQRQARTYLRRALWMLKNGLGEQVLITDGDNLGVDPTVSLWLDVDHFYRLLSNCQQHDHPTDVVCPDCLNLMEQAVNLHRGTFLAGFTLSDSTEFDEWQFFQTDSLQQALTQTLKRLVQGYSTIGEYDSAVPHAQHWVNMDPLYEPAQRVLMELYYQTGQISAALRQYKICTELLETELGMPPEQETIAVYEQIKTGRMVGVDRNKIIVKGVLGSQKLSLQLAESSPITANNLPVQPTPFVGREKTLAEISKLLRDESGCRLLSLVGPGGIGKTRLALEAAVRTGEAFSDGTFFVSLASVADVAYLVPAIAEAFKLNFQGDIDPKTQLFNHIRRRNYLLILDNFEHLLSAPRTSLTGSGMDVNETTGGGEQLISEILRAGLEIKILVTTRERLKIQEEWIYEVQGMPFPRDLRSFETDPVSLADYAAIELFVQRARKADARFTYTTDVLPSIIRICQLVDGMPLGIELAAPWVRLMPCHQIADEIQGNFDLLTTSLRNVPERHRSMRAIFEQTWQRLSSEEQNVLSKLSVFRGGCLRDAAQSVADATLPLLSSLVDNALLRHSSVGRYELHELIRQFAQEQLLRISNAYTQTLDNHYQYFTTFLQRQIEGLKSGTQLEVARRIANDIDNVRLAWHRAVDVRDVDAIERSAEGLYLYCELSGALAEGEEAFHQALSAFDPQRADTNGLKGFILSAQGALCAHRGDLKKGQAMLEQGIALINLEEDQDQYVHKKAYALMWLGWVLFLQAKNERVADIIQESLTLFTKIGDQWGVARNLYIMGNSLTGSGRLAEAEQPLRKSLAICREIGDRRSRLLADWNLAILTFWFGDYIQTEQYLDDAVMLGKELNDQIGLALALKELGKLEVAQGKYSQAIQTLKESIAITDEIGSQWESAATLDDLGFALCMIGDYTAAETALKQCLDAAQARQHHYFIARSYGNLGLLSYSQESYQRAEEYLQGALAIWRGLGHEPYCALTMYQLGHVLQAVGQDRYTAARQYYKQALQRSVEHKLAPFAMEIMTELIKLMEQADLKRNVMDLLTFIKSHPSSTYDTKAKAQKLLVDLGPDFSLELDSESGLRSPAEWQMIAMQFMDGFDKPI